MKRRGYTLVEMLIVVGLLAMIAAGATVLLAAVMLHVGRQRDNYQTAQVASQLAADLRRDAHAAALIDVSDPPSKLTLALGQGEVVEYALIDSGVERVATGMGTTRRELYRLPRLSELRFAREEIAPGRSIIACLWRQPWHGPRLMEREQSPLRDHRIEAALTSEVRDE